MRINLGNLLCGLQAIADAIKASRDEVHHASCTLIDSGQHLTVSSSTAFGAMSVRLDQLSGEPEEPEERNGPAGASIRIEPGALWQFVLNKSECEDITESLGTAIELLLYIQRGLPVSRVQMRQLLHSVVNVADWYAENKDAHEVAQWKP